MTSTQKARRSLDGLSVGDAFGQKFFGDEETVRSSIVERRLPPAPWYLTDDSIMAIAVVDCLIENSGINQDWLAERFAQYYRISPRRGYGGSAHRVLRGLCAGEHWREISPTLFDGMGSHGNGAAMRVAPLGAYFADDLDRLVNEASLSAEVTHAHEDGIAGAIAIALAAAWAAGNDCSTSMFSMVLDQTPVSETRSVIDKARRLDPDLSLDSAASILGNGHAMSAQDTVPFVLWLINRHYQSYEDALWETVSVLGDRDTTCAMVGGIICLKANVTLPQQWMKRRESLNDWKKNEDPEGW